MQHRLLVTDVEIRGVVKRKRAIGVYKVKWWNLTTENVTKLSKNIKTEGNWSLEGDVNKIWEEMVECTQRSTREVLKASRWGSRE